MGGFACAFLGSTANAATVNVTNTGDSGEGSLRSALFFAGDHPGTTINFAIAGNSLKNGVALIAPSTPLPLLVADGTTINGNSQTAFGGNTNPDGPEVMLDGGRLPDNPRGLGVVAAHCRVQGLIVSGFAMVGVAFNGSRAFDNRVSGCYIGTDASGTKAHPNGYGVQLGDGTHHNFIGGLSRAQRNVVSGNAVLGIALYDCAHNTVQGCFVGLDAHGKDKLPNGMNGVQMSRGATDNLLGGGQEGARNLLSGNAKCGCYIYGPDARRNRIEGNFIGLDVSGTQPRGNGVAGVECNGAQDNVIGGAQAGGGNILSDNLNGVHLIEGASHNTVQGNIIGLDVSGHSAIPNLHSGILAESDAHDNLLGGASAGARNVLSGNGRSGIDLAYGSYKNQVQGNIIGLDIAGETSIPNIENGVTLRESAHDNSLGGAEDGARNIISGNGFTGILLAGGTHNNRVQGNFVGTTLAGVAPLFNKNYAVMLCRGAHDNLIGGPKKGARNILAANSPIVFFTDEGTTNNSVEGNNIGVDVTDTRNLLQGWAGVQFSNGATGNSLGGLDRGQGNLIAVTTATKDQYIGNSTIGNLIQKNTPFTNANETETDESEAAPED